jgi:hypothetical protein
MENSLQLLLVEHALVLRAQFRPLHRRHQIPDQCACVHFEDPNQFGFLPRNPFCSATVSAAVVGGVSPATAKGEAALATAGKMPALPNLRPGTPLQLCRGTPAVFPEPNFGFWVALRFSLPNPRALAPEGRP